MFIQLIKQEKEVNLHNCICNLACIQSLNDVLKGEILIVRAPSFLIVFKGEISHNNNRHHVKSVITDPSTHVRKCTKKKQCPAIAIKSKWVPCFSWGIDNMNWSFLLMAKQCLTRFPMAPVRPWENTPLHWDDPSFQNASRTGTFKGVMGGATPFAVIAATG